MNEKRDRDEKLLIDFLLGRLGAAEAEAARRRLATDEAFSELRRDLANTFAAMRLSPEIEPPDDLVARTMDRIRRQHATDALLARERPAGRFFAPTFNLREVAALAAAAIVLVAIFVPSVLNAKRVAQIGQCASNQGQTAAAALNYANVHDGYLPSADGHTRRWMSTDNQPAVSNSAALFKLVTAKYASPVYFQCPAVGGGSFVVQSGMVDFPGAKFISYSYQHTMGTKKLRANDPALQQVKEHMAILADSTPLFESGHFRRDRVNAPASDNHGGTGQNVLYFDGHVEWKTVAAAGVNGDNIFWAGDTKDYQGTEEPARDDDTFLLPAYSPSQPAQ